MRRFTRRARNRRIAAGVIAGVIASLVALVLVAVYSPILALRSITVEGTALIDAEQVREAVGGQLGTPLALLDFDRITRELSVFPLIRSYVTEIVPPDTLVIHLTERAPVGQVADGAGFTQVDPAGVAVRQSAEREPGLPVLELGSAGASGAEFDAVVEVLLALPPDLLAKVDRASARTKDDVSLTLAGVGQGVEWGSSEDSERKAALLTALIGLIDPAQPGTFDVSAPSNGIFHPA